MVIRAFITHKQAERFADCQDRFGVNTDTKSIAVSDGMGSTWQQKIWAQLLVETYTNSRDWNLSKESIIPLCQEWRAKVSEFIQNLKDTNAPENIIYRNERNFAEGRSAGATFVGIRLDGSKWSGEVLGDTCLIEWDGNEAKFNTSQDTDAFDSYPDYFDSNPLKDGKGTPKSIEGTLTDDKKLLLVSDPFSEFLLEHSKQGDIAKYVQQLLSVASHDDFEVLVDEWRKEGMHNDDTTLVIVESDNAEALTITYADNIAEMVEKEQMDKESVAEKVEAESTENTNATSAIEQVTDKQDESPYREKECNASDPVNADTIIEEFLTEYKSVLEGKCKGKSQKAIKKFWSELQYKTTQNAAKEALRTILDKYVIYAK
ncbi:MAG: protein phosphatase 2C domain-containing protein [Alloprevotella sp.]|nr:protein phosphatase 2C domain-containing protein [Alloprevotella sp.]